MYKLDKDGLLNLLANVNAEIEKTPLAVRKAFLDRVEPTHELYRQVKIYKVLVEQKEFCEFELQRRAR